MPNFLLTYDLRETNPSPHKAVLTAAEAEDLLYVYQAESGKLLRLPNTTLWGQFASAADAKGAFDRAIAEAERVIGRPIKLEKRAITKLSNAKFLSDQKKAPEIEFTADTGFETCRAHQLNDEFFS